MADTNTRSQLIDINGLSVFKERMDASVDEKIAEAGQGVTYTLSKNDMGEIVLTGTDKSVTKVTDENTTYNFTQNGTILTITPSTGDAIEIQLGEDITSSKIIEALGYTPANETDIPSEVTESTISSWGFTKNTGTYSKPSSGIPKTDFTSDVQMSLGKADTALQSFTEKDPTVPSYVKAISTSDISNWNSKSDFSGDYNDLENKPTIPTVPTNISDFNNDVGYLTVHQDISGKQNKTDNNLNTTDKTIVGAINELKTSKSDSGHTHDDRYYTESEINTKLNSKLNTSLKGSNNGLAELDENGKVPSAQLPSFVDDVIEGYLYNGSFYKESAHSTKITGESGKIYIDLATEKTYRWSGSAFAIISETLALGETSSTAYRGDRGKTAYDHSQSTHARTDATKVEKSSTNGNIKINGTETTVYTHPSGTNPHGTTKSDVGLGNVGNFKAVSTVANQGLTDTEKLNARANIGAGTSSFSGSYNDLSNKPTIPTVGNGTITITQNGTTKGTFTTNQSGNTTIALTDNNTTYGVATSSALGLVKSGTDITVDSNGNVSVNDDSHNHVISNVDGLQSALDGKSATGHTHDDRYYTESEIDSKLFGKASSSHTHSAYVNQNAFSNVVVGSTTVAADSATDTLTLVAGSNVTITPDATNDKITISATNTTYSAISNTTIDNLFA